MRRTGVAAHILAKASTCSTGPNTLWTSRGRSASTSGGMDSTGTSQSSTGCGGVCMTTPLTSMPSGTSVVASQPSITWSRHRPRRLRASVVSATVLATGPRSSHSSAAAGNSAGSAMNVHFMRRVCRMAPWPHHAFVHTFIHMAPAMPEEDERPQTMPVFVRYCRTRQHGSPPKGRHALRGAGGAEHDAAAERTQDAPRAASCFPSVLESPLSLRHQMCDEACDGIGFVTG